MKALHVGGCFFEGPRWHEGAWWVSDLYALHVLKVTEEGTATVVARIDGQPSGLGWLPDGDLLAISMADKHVVRVSGDGSLATFADLSPYAEGLANDMIVDRQGRAYVGNMGFDLSAGETPRNASLVMVDVNQEVRVVAEDLRFPNGMVITPDGNTLIVSESFASRMTAFSIAPDGSLTNRRCWAELGPLPGWSSVQDIPVTEFAPDGCSVMDAEGCIWVADAFHQRVCRIGEGGAIRDEVKMPEGMSAFACALGGVDGQTLLICASSCFDREGCMARRDASLLVHRVPVPASAS